MFRLRSSWARIASFRRIERHLDSWLQSELQRFHRGIFLALIFLAVLILVIEMIRYNRLEDLLVLAALLAPIGAMGRTWSSRILGTS